MGMILRTYIQLYADKKHTPHLTHRFEELFQILSSIQLPFPHELVQIFSHISANVCLSPLLLEL